MALDIIIYISAMAGAVLLARHWGKCSSVRKLWSVWIVLIIVIIILTGVLTYHSPNWLIFANLG